MNANSFPLRIASGKAFCNRTTERDKLKKLILTGQHLWLQAHRRHGKTSLILQALNDLKIEDQQVLFQRVDLAFTTDRSSALKKLCQTASKLIIETMSTAKNINETNKLSIIGQRLQDVFTRYAPSFSLDRGQPSMTFGKEASLDMMGETLKKLNELGKEHNIRIVFMIDEFQQLSKVDNKSFDIEGEIRHHLELSSNVTYVFCGSERNLMQQAMADQKRPLYKHTYRFEIERISKNCYLDHIKPIWEKQYNNTFDMTVFEYAMKVTQRHPYYVNYIFSELWLSDTHPTLDDANDAWRKIVDEELNENKNMILNLKSNEKKALKAIAIKPTKQITSNEFIQLSGIPTGSAKKTINQLVDKDLIYLNDGKYHVVNPALGALAQE